MKHVVEKGSKLGARSIINIFYNKKKEMSGNKVCRMSKEDLIFKIVCSAIFESLRQIGIIYLSFFKVLY